jgi:hypothetical protein
MLVKKINHDSTLVLFKNPTEVMSRSYENIELVSPESYCGNLNQITDSEWAFGSGISGKDTWDMLIKGRLNSSLQKSYNQHSCKISFNSKLPSVKRRRLKNEYDGEICIDSYLSSDPFPYRKVSRVKSQDRAVRVLVNVGYLSSTSSKELLDYISKAIKKVEGLIKKGYLVEVYASSTSTDTGVGQFKNLFTLLKIKESDKPMDLYRMQTAILPGFFRSAIFRAKNIVNHLYNAGIDDGLGRSVNTKNNKELLQYTLEKLKNIVGGKFIYYDGSTEEGIEGIEI